MIPTQRLPASLTPLDVALAALLQRVTPVAPVSLSLAEALGCVAADMPPLQAVPRRGVLSRRAASPRPRRPPPPPPAGARGLGGEAGDTWRRFCACVVDADS